MRRRRAAAAATREQHAARRGTRSWDSSAAFRIALSSVQPDGGRLPCVQLRVVRVYGPLLFSRTGGYSSRAAFEALQQQAADETREAATEMAQTRTKIQRRQGRTRVNAAAWTERDRARRGTWRLLAVDTSAGAAPTGADSPVKLLCGAAPKMGGSAEGATFNVVGAALDAGWTARASADGDAFNVVGASISVSVAGLLPQPQPQPCVCHHTATTAAAAAACSSAAESTS